MDPLFWWLFIVGVFLVGIFSQVYVLAAIAGMLLVLGALAAWWQARALREVTYRRRLHYRRGFPGETIEFQAEVENRKFLPVSWLKITDQWPVAVGPQDESILAPTERAQVGLLINLFALRWFERSRRSYTLLLRKRGVYRLGPARLESGDLFGLFERTSEDETPDYLTVFPERLPLAALRLPSDDPFGDRRTRRPLYEDPNLTIGVRAYGPQDDFRRVHWPATAHTGSLQVKVYQPVSARVLIVCLNISTQARYWEGVRLDLLEQLVRVSATLVEHSLTLGYRVGLASNGALAHSDQPFRVPAGRSTGQLARLLETLAGVTPFVTASFERFLAAETGRLPYGATLVIVTALLPPALAEAALRLKRYGHRITLVSLAAQPPAPLPGINVMHLPFPG